ncbi:MAG: hypothetical protein ACOCQG_05885 [Candidatus Nanoarchaeia archaeon]
MAVNKIAIISALPDEVDVFKKILHGSDKWDDKEVKIAVGGIGKVAAAATTQKIISEFKPDILFFTGMAGALEEGREIGDIGVVSACIDSGYDARRFDPSLKLGQFPFTGERIFKSDPRLVDLALNSPINARIFDAYEATSSIFMDMEKKREFVEKVCPELEDEIHGTRRRPNLVDMECIGFLTAAKANYVPALALKTVSNTLSGDTRFEYSDSLMNERTRTYLDIVAYIMHNY